MNIVRRAWAGPPDFERMAALARANAAACVHMVDLPYRFASWAFDDPQNCALWERDGALVAWAVVQTPFWAIDYVVDADVASTLLPDVLAWADERAHAVRGGPFERPIWFVSVLENAHDQRRALEHAGFASQANVGENSWSKTLLGRPGQHAAPAAVLPPGFILRPLGGPAEVDAYVALHRAVFGSDNMTVPWRARTLRAAAYRPDLDLVVADPAGQLAAFCVGWWLADGPNGQPVGQIEPFGVREDLRRSGIGRALMAACVERFRALHAAHVAVESDLPSDASMFYRAQGFVDEHAVLVYRKDYPGANN